MTVAKFCFKAALPALIGGERIWDILSCMDAVAYRWSDIEPDEPIALLARQRVFGANVLAANVRLQEGCHVALHRHPSEQLAIVVSGHVRWTIGAEGSPDQRMVDMRGGELLMIPSDVWHGVDAVEDTQIIDVLSPPGEMGVDRQDS